MRVFVTGGTGFAGPAVVGALLSHGHAVTALVHRRAPPGAVRVVRGDVADPALDLAGHDAVVHLVGIIKEKGAATFERMHVEATWNVLAAAKRASVGRFLHMSALGAREGATKYWDTKARAERIVRASGLDWTIFRPSFIVGEGKGFDRQWADIARLGVLPRFGKGDFLMQPVARADVAEAFARALVTPASVGKVYELGGPERFTFADYERRLLERMRIRRPVLPVPKGLARLGAAAFHRVPGFPADPEALDMLFEGSVTDDDAWTRDLGIRPTTWHEASAFLAPSP